MDGNLPRARTTVTPQLVLGVFLLLVGVMLTLDRLNILDADLGLRFWPLLLVAVGGKLLADRSDPKSRFWGTVWVFVGLWLLLNSLGLVRVGFWDLFWPVLIIFLGVSIIRQAYYRGQSTLKGTSSGGAHLAAILGESKRTVTDNPFEGGELTAFMGGCVLDLRQAVLPPGASATIDVFAMMAGHEVFVPNGWVVESRIVPIMGGVDDKRLPSGDNTAVEGRPRLIMRGLVIMGGLVIKS
jgi:Domain of unknown function (DUF5668)